MKVSDPKCYRYVDFEKAAAGGQDMLSPYQAMGNNPVSSMDPGGTAYYSMENYVDNRGNRFYLSSGTIASLGLPWTGDPTGFTPPPSWDYGAFFDASCNAAMIDFARQEFENYLKRVQGDRQDENKIAQKYGLNTVTLMLNLTVPLDNKWYYHDPGDNGNGDGNDSPSSHDITPFELGVEWLTGKGPRHRDFTNGDYMTELLRQHSHVQDTRGIILADVANGGTVGLTGSNKYSLGGVKGGRFIYKRLFYFIDWWCNWKFGCYVSWLL